MVKKKYMYFIRLTHAFLIYIVFTRLPIWPRFRVYTYVRGVYSIGEINKVLSFFSSINTKTKTKTKTKPKQRKSEK